MTTNAIIDFNDPAFHANPYPFYHELRATNPVYWAEMPPPLNGMWLCTRYADVASVLKEARLTKHRLDMMRAGEVTANQRSMLSEDPPDHTRLRSLVSQAFTPKRVQGLQSRIEEIANHLIDQVAGQGGMNFVTAFAQPLPVIVIAELLGVPPEDADQDIFCLPGTVVNLSGYFRLSLTASDAMIEKSIPGFAAAFAVAQAR